MAARGAIRQVLVTLLGPRAAGRAGLSRGFVLIALVLGDDRSMTYHKTGSYMANNIGSGLSLEVIAPTVAYNLQQARMYGTCNTSWIDEQTDATQWNGPINILFGLTQGTTLPAVITESTQANYNVWTGPFPASAVSVSAGQPPNPSNTGPGKVMFAIACDWAADLGVTVAAGNALYMSVGFQGAAFYNATLNVYLLNTYDYWTDD